MHMQFRVASHDDSELRRIAQAAWALEVGVLDWLGFSTTARAAAGTREAAVQVGAPAGHVHVRNLNLDARATAVGPDSSRCRAGPDSE